MRKIRSDAKVIDLLLAVEMHLKNGLSLHEIAQHFNIHHTNLMRRFRRLEIPIRDRKTAIKIAKRLDKRGLKNHNWKGGVSQRKDGYLVENRTNKYIHRIVGASH